jgi:glycosyltransferase involved in cell wall biosynthesis
LRKLESEELMMKRKLCPRVSVVIPAYNAEAFVAQTLHSALSQTYPNLEILVVDDGSRDRTVEQVECLARGDARIKLLRQENSGVAAARNRAIQHSTGDYIAPLDADDLWLPEKIEKQVDALEIAGPRASLAYTWCLSIDEDGNLLGGGPHWDLEGEVYQALVLRNFIGNASVPLFRKTHLEEAGGYRPEFHRRNAGGCEDWDLSLRLAERGEFRVVKEYLTCYRSHTRSMSFNHASMGRSYHCVLEDVQRRHPEIPRHVFRWSQSIFYLYLANKSNLCGDHKGALNWLLEALRHDPAVLLLPWVNTCLVKNLIRLSTRPLTSWLCGENDVWRRFARPRPESVSASPLSPEQVAARTRSKRIPRRLWDRIQVARWAEITNQRSYSCC